MSKTYEIEIKSLLGSKENAERLRQSVEKRGGKLVDSNKQLNHYFVVSDKEKFLNQVVNALPADRQNEFQQIVSRADSLSVRTRDANGKVRLVVKASIGSDTSANGVSRQEFEVGLPMTLEKLDEALLGAGLEYQAKWSREREEFALGDTHICLDKNAGYGYLAEFERVIDDSSKADEVKGELASLMSEFGAVELAQDRLERMFAYYNTHWPDYYGTDKVFNIK